MPDSNEFERIGKIGRFAENGERSTEGLPITKGFPQRQKPKRVWFNALFYDITRKIDELIDAVNRLGNADNPIYQMYDVGDVFVTTNHYGSPEAVAQAKGYGTWRRYSQGRALVGYTANLDDRAEYAVMGNEFGEDEHILTIEEMPSHSHRLKHGHDNGDVNSTPGTIASDTENWSGLWIPSKNMEEVGGNAPHNNTQPSTVVAFWLRVA